MLQKKRLLESFGSWKQESEKCTCKDSPALTEKFVNC